MLGQATSTAQHVGLAYGIAHNKIHTVFETASFKYDVGARGTLWCHVHLLLFKCRSFWYWLRCGQSFHSYVHCTVCPQFIIIRIIYCLFMWFVINVYMCCVHWLAIEIRERHLLPRSRLESHFGGMSTYVSTCTLCAARCMWTRLKMKVREVNENTEKKRVTTSRKCPNKKKKLDTTFFCCFYSMDMYRRKPNDETDKNAATTITINNTGAKTCIKLCNFLYSVYFLHRSCDWILEPF